MFKDYYKILEIKIDVNSDEIKKSYRKQAMKWHPDRNIGVDTTSYMRDINEAKLILLDVEARMKYDIEYRIFYNQYQSDSSEKMPNEEFDEKSKNYHFTDEDLKRWMNNAREQAVDLAKQTIIDFRGIAKAGCLGALKEGLAGFAVQIIISIVVMLFIIIGC